MSEITINYGPYESNGVVRHKQQRLYGLINELKKMQMIVHLRQTPHWNRITVHLCDRLICRCNILSLGFNTPCEIDPFCQVIIALIKEARNRFLKLRNVKRTCIDYSKGKQIEFSDDCVFH